MDHYFSKKMLPIKYSTLAKLFEPEIKMEMTSFPQSTEKNISMDLT
jgi:hypothetical protein